MRDYFHYPCRERKGFESTKTGKENFRGLERTRPANAEKRAHMKRREKEHQKLKPTQRVSEVRGGQVTRKLGAGKCERYQSTSRTISGKYPTGESSFSEPRPILQKDKERSPYRSAGEQRPSGAQREQTVITPFLEGVKAWKERR